MRRDQIGQESETESGGAIRQSGSAANAPPFRYKKIKEGNEVSKRADQQAVCRAVRALIIGEARQRDPKKRERSERFLGRGERADLYKYKGTHCCQTGKFV